MLLNELLNDTCARIAKLSDIRAELIGVVTKTQEALKNNEYDLTAAIHERDSLLAAKSIVPESIPRIKNDCEELRQKRRTIFAQFQEMPGVWIKPFGIAVMSEMETKDVCVILRRAAKIEGIPLEHNGKVGYDSMYRWVGEKKKNL